jgi:4-hydroxybenzoate polyprenyltransferase
MNNLIFAMMGKPMQSQPERPDTVIDAPKGNWVDEKAPSAWRPWLRMSRADRPIGTWLLLLPCWWGVGLAMMSHGPAWRDIWIIIACGIGALVMRGAGCTWNDITDRDFDAQVARTKSRPLPSGQVSLRGAYLWLIAQGLVGFVILLTLGQAAIWMGVVSLALIAIYPFAKRFTWWPQVFLGLAFNWGVMLAYAAHAGTLGLAPVVAWLGGIAWTIFYDTIYAHQDVEDDALIGVKSTARLFGENSPRILAGFAALAVALLALAIALTGRNQLIAYLGLAGFAGHLIWQLMIFKPDQGDVCLRLFRSNRDAGLILALFLAIAGVM